MLRGRFGDSSGRPYISAWVNSPSLGLVGHVSFLVDSGADATVLMPADARKIGFDFATARKTGRSHGIGGSAATSGLDAFLLFYDREDQCLYGYDTGRLAVIHPAGTVMERAPSLLGRDILDNWCWTCDRLNDDLSAVVHRSDVKRQLQEQET